MSKPDGTPRTIQLHVLVAAMKRALCSDWMIERILADAFQMPEAEAKAWASIPPGQLPDKAEPVQSKVPESFEELNRALQEAELAKDYPRMVVLVEKIIELELKTVPLPAKAQERVARYHEVIGQLCVELGDHERAIDSWNHALDLNAARMEPFQKVVRLLTQRKEWLRLERTYRKALHRSLRQSNNELMFGLWRDLGNLYADRLNDHRSAAEAFAAALTIQNDETIRRRLDGLKRE